jgi:DNA processing protein
MNDEQLAYLALALTPGIGPIRLDALLNTFGSWSGALSAPFEFLCTTPTMSRPAATAVSQATLALADRALTQTEALGGVVLLPDDPRFPRRFAHLTDAPAVLFAMGNLALLEPEAVAIVGSRHPSSYGIGTTREVTRIAARAGLVVVSGMARGLDAIAHWTALEHGAGTIGVLGNGLGVVYPAANAALYERVTSAGLLVTEYPPGERPNAGSFVTRNRLISGLAKVTIVVEAAEESGTLSTARAALEQGRDVMAVPGPLTSRLSIGTNRLIRKGAAPFLDASDLLAKYPDVSRAAREELLGAPEPDERVKRLERNERRVYGIVDGIPRETGAIGHELGLSAAEVLAALTELELAGLVDRLPTGYVRA